MMRRKAQWVGIDTLTEIVSSLNSSTSDLAENVIKLQRDFDAMTNVMLKHAGQARQPDQGDHRLAD